MPETITDEEIDTIELSRKLCANLPWKRMGANHIFSHSNKLVCEVYATPANRDYIIACCNAAPALIQRIRDQTKDLAG